MTDQLPLESRSLAMLLLVRISLGRSIDRPWASQIRKLMLTQTSTAHGDPSLAAPMLTARFSTNYTRGYGGACTGKLYKRLASLLAEKQGRPYSSTLHWLKCRLNFSLLRSAIMYIRGSRSVISPHSTSPPTESIDLALHEGKVPAF